MPDLRRVLCATACLLGGTHRAHADLAPSPGELVVVGGVVQIAMVAVVAGLAVLAGIVVGAVILVRRRRRRRAQD